MARPRTIDRERVLSAAETVVTEGGAASLSFSTVAARAGLSKATVQSLFGCRDALIEAMIARWLAHETRRYRAYLGEDASDDARLRAHLASTRAEMATGGGRHMATLLASFVSEGRQSDNVRRWYRERLGDLGADSADDRRRRIAYLAAEGAYFLRCVVGVEADESFWSEVFEDLESPAVGAVIGRGLGR